MKVTKAEIAEVLNLKPLQGLTISQALIAAHAEKIDREANYRYWAQRGSAGRGYRIAVAKLEAIEHVINVLEAAQAINLVAATESTPVAEIAQPVKARAPRCPHYKAIRQAFGIAKGAGLDTKADEDMRAAFSRFLCRDIASREELTGAEWDWIGAAIKRNELAW